MKILKALFFVFAIGLFSSCNKPPFVFHWERTGNKPLICFKDYCRKRHHHDKEQRKLVEARIKEKEKAIARGDSTYSVKVNKRTKTYKIREASISRDQMDSTEAVLALEKKKKKIRYKNTVIGAVYFSSSSSGLDGEAFWVLDDVAVWIEEHPETIIEVSGHTDSTGSRSHNSSLSKSRVKSVGKYLIKEKGVDKHRLIPAAYGSGIPIATNGTEDGREKNRRVELKVIAE
jgi:outer membrane protein OmpA-like peptidoglycan-associated protein